jgi:hypothetical protein
MQRPLVTRDILNAHCQVTFASSCIVCAVERIVEIKKIMENTPYITKTQKNVFSRKIHPFVGKDN